jgi:excisionase family DNA binding protein
LTKKALMDQKETGISSSLLTPEQVSEILQIHILTVYEYIKRGKLGAVRLGRSYRISTQDLDELLALNRVGRKKY